MLYKGSFIDIEHATKESLLEFFNWTLKMRRAFESIETGQSSWFTSMLQRNAVPVQIGMLFQSPSSRTYSAFYTAASMLGGVVQKLETTFSSTVSTKDDILQLLRIHHELGVGGFVVREDGAKSEGRIREIADVCGRIGSRIISAGENHRRQPVQTLADLQVVYEYERSGFFKKPLSYAVVGDMESPTVAGFLYGISLLGAKSLVVVCKDDDKLPLRVEEWLTNVGIPISYTDQLVDAAPKADVWYFTSYREKTFGHDTGMIDRAKLKEYVRCFGVSEAFRRWLSPYVIVIHPLPHGGEFDLFIDKIDPRFVHMKAMKQSLFTKAMLMMMVFNPQSTYFQPDSLFKKSIV